MQDKIVIHGAVSYTHLDVYKRQIQYIEDVNKAGKKLSASILGNKTFVEKVEEDTPTPEPQPTPQPVSYTHLAAISFSSINDIAEPSL